MATSSALLGSMTAPPRTPCALPPPPAPGATVDAERSVALGWLVVVLAGLVAAWAWPGWPRLVIVILMAGVGAAALASSALEVLGEA